MCFSKLAGGAATDLLTDRDKMAMLVLGGSALALGYFAAREGTAVAGKAVSAYLGTPKLIRETSRPKPWALLRGPPKGIEAARGFADVVLPTKLQDHIAHLAASTTNTKKHGAPFRHMLFYGPPGTGKSLAAKRLARTSGLHYAILSGGDVAPLGGGAVTQLHEIFDWYTPPLLSPPFKVVAFIRSASQRTSFTHIYLKIRPLFDSINWSDFDKTECEKCFV
jgi:ATPase family AAA domain-containing protein 3A/B